MWLRIVLGAYFLVAGCLPGDAPCMTGFDGIWEGEQLAHPLLAPIGSQTLVYWARGGIAQRALVSESGVIEATELPDLDLSYAALIPGPQEHLLLWRDRERDVLLGQRLDTRGAELGERIEVGPFTGESLQGIRVGPEYWIAWVNGELPRSQSLLVARLDATGVAIDPEPTVLATGDVGRVVLARIDRGVWIAWSTWDGIEGALLSLGGETLVGPLTLVPRGASPQIASLGDEALVVGLSIQPDGVAYARHLGRNGPLSDERAVNLRSAVRDVLDDRPDVTGLVGLPDGTGYALLAQIGSYTFPCDACELQSYVLKRNGEPRGCEPRVRRKAAAAAAIVVGDSFRVMSRIGTRTSEEGTTGVGYQQMLFRVWPLEGEPGQPVELDRTDYAVVGEDLSCY